MSKEMKKYQQRIIGRVKKLSKKDYAALQDFMETSAARIVRGVLGEELFDGMDVDQYRKGGIVKKSEGGKVQKTGFVEGSPDNYAKGDTVADTVKTKVRENSFVLNAPTVERLQEAGMLPKGVDNSNKNATIKANKGGLMDVALSKGEYVIEPEEAQRIGYSFLEKINDQGKPEVDRRQMLSNGGIVDFGAIRPTGDEYEDTNITGFDMLVARGLGVNEDINRALAVSQAYDEQYQPKDNDRSRDTLRHILGGGYMHNQSGGFAGFLEGIAADAYDSREGTEFYPEESAIDLNNNKYGRKLREMFPDKDQFTRAAIAAVEMLRKGEAFEAGGMKPMMSQGYDVAAEIRRLREAERSAGLPRGRKN